MLASPLHHKAGAQRWELTQRAVVERHQKDRPARPAEAVSLQAQPHRGPKAQPALARVTRMTARKKVAHPASRAADLPAAVVPAPRAVPVGQQDQEVEVVQKPKAVVAAQTKKIALIKAPPSRSTIVRRLHLQAVWFSSEISHLRH